MTMNNRGSGRFDWALIITFSLIVTAIYGGRILAGTKGLLIPGDAFDQSFMWLSKVFNAARQGTIVLWDFSTSSGVSFIGEQQTAPLYPLALLFGWLGLGTMPRAYDQFLLLHYAIAAAGAACLFRRFGVNWLAAFVGALVFAFTGLFADRVLHQPNFFCSLAYLPWMAWGLVLCSLEEGVKARTTGFVVGAASVALSTLAGHVYAVAIGMVSGVILVGAVACFVKGAPLRAIVSTCLLGGAILLVGALLALPQVVATHEYLKLTYKWNSFGPTKYPHLVSAGEYASYALHASDLASLWGRPTGFKDGGTLFFTLTGLALVLLLPLSWSQMNRWQRSGALAAVLAIGVTTVFAMGWLYPHLPFFNQVRTPTRWLFGTALMLALLVALSLNGLAARWTARMRGANAATRHLPAVLLALLVVIESLRFFSAHIEQPPWSTSKAAASLSTPVLLALEKEMHRYPPVYRFFAPTEIVVPNTGNYRFSLATEGHRATRTVIYHDYFDWNPSGEHLRNLAVRWYVSDAEIPGLRKVWTDGVHNIFEREDVLPVLWVLKSDGKKIAAPIRTVRWKENSVDFELAAPVQGTVMFAQTYYPGFRAVADGQRYQVQNVDDLMGIRLRAPASTFTFAYRPDFFRWSAGVSLATLLLMLLALIHVQRSVKKVD